MRNWTRFSWFLTVTLVVTVVGFANDYDRYHEPSMTGGQITVNTTSPLRGVTRMQFTNPMISREEVTVGNERFTDVWIPGESHTTESGLPSLPVVNRLIGIPDQGAVQLRVLSAEYTEETGVRIYPFQTMDENEAGSSPFRWNQDFYRQAPENGWYPANIATLAEPAVLRDVRLVTVSICPIQYNPFTNTVRIYYNIDIQVEPAPGVGINEKTRTFPHPSSLFMPMYQQLDNFQYLEMDEETQTPGTYLIICANDPTPIGYAEQIAVWKQRKGFTTRIATRTETGNGFSQIRSFIQNLYNTSDPPLEFVLLIGDDTNNPNSAFHVPSSGGYGGSDHQYTQVAGTDILGDIAIGRLSAGNTGDMNLLVTKTLRYEQNPYITGPDWFTKAYLLAGITDNLSSNVNTMEYIRQQMYDDGFTEVVLHTHDGNINGSLMRQQLDQGRSFFLWRGAYVGEMNSSNLTGLNNGWMTPFVFVLTCGTGDFAGTTGLSENWVRFGSLATGGGAVACVGTATTGTHTRFNNIIAAGIGHGFFANRTPEVGLALMEAKFQLYRSYYPQNSYEVSEFSYWNNLMGDPGLRIWTAHPAEFQVTHPTTIPLGANRVSVMVNDEQSDPVENAVVTVMNPDGSGWTRAVTDASGYLEMSAAPQTEGTLWLTISKINYLTYTADITVSQQELWMAFDSAAVDDDNNGGTSGNGDGELNPGEIVDLTVTAHNYGSSITATNVMGTMSSFNDLLAQVTTGVQPFPNIAPGAEVLSQGPYRVQISISAQDQDMTPLLLEFQSSEQTDTSLVSLPVISGTAEFQSRRFPGGNSRLDPGETADMLVSIRNGGHRDVTNVQGQLFCSDPLITFANPNSGYGSITMGQNVTNIDNFQVTASSETFPGHPVQLGMSVSGDDGFRDTVYFQITVGLQSLTDPAGPDNYGYYCFDNTDTLNYELAPRFEWIEIDPGHGGSGEILPIYDNYEGGDDNTVRPLPFSFRMYGVDYDTITVCSNGWAALGNQRMFDDFRNYPIPGPLGPDAMLAIFWDDLIMSGGHVCWEYQETEGRLVMEWSAVRTYGTYQLEIFEIILYDPTLYPTETGDGLIKYQYFTVVNTTGSYADNDYATVGIEDHTQLDGLQVSYWNTYSPGSAPLTAGRAYLFTTLYTSSPTEENQPISPTEYSLGQNYPNPFNPVTFIPYSIRESGIVKLNLYNVLGQKLITLVNEQQEAGLHRAFLDASSLASGIYFYRIEAGTFTQTRKMVLLK